MKLIVVDDEEDVQTLFEQRFRREILSGELQIHFALNGPSALTMLESFENRNEFLILTDINMPEMNGIELLKVIKSRYPELKVVVITAYEDKNNVEIAKRYGADDYFTKPLEFKLLKTKLNTLDAV